MEITFTESPNRPVSAFLKQWLDNVKSAETDDRLYFFATPKVPGRDEDCEIFQLGYHPSQLEAVAAAREAFPGQGGMVMGPAYLANVDNGDTQNLKTFTLNELVELNVGLIIHPTAE